MNLLQARKNISVSNVFNITKTDFWLLGDDKEYFVPFAQYPEFKHASVDAIFAVERLSPTQFYWKKIDCDIELAALEKSKQFPLQFKHSH